MKAGKVFINYRREDSKAWSLLLYKALEPAFGAERIFYDIDTIPPGEDFVWSSPGSADSYGLTGVSASRAILSNSMGDL